VCSPMKKKYVDTFPLTENERLAELEIQQKEAAVQKKQEDKCA